MKKFLAALIIIPTLLLTGLNYFAPQVIFDGAIKLMRSAAGMESRFISIDSRQYHYLDSGEDGLPTILFIHGFTADADNWTRMAINLKGDYRLVAIDLLGHGQSDKPMDANYLVSTQATNVAQFIDALDLDNVHLIGNSMGGHIAAMIAARHPQHIASVTLLNNAGIISPIKSDAWKAIEAGKTNPLVIRTPEDTERFLDYVMEQKPFMTNSLKRYFAERAIANEKLYETIFGFLIPDNFEDLTLELHKIKVPVNIIWGKQDRVLHVSSIDVMKPLLEGETVTILEDTGHGPMVERPNKTAALLDDFIRGL